MHKSKPAVWLDILLIAAAIGLAYFLACVLPQIAPGTAVTAASTQTNASSTDTSVHQGRLPGYEDAKVNENSGYFWYLYNGKVKYASAAAPGNVMLENTVGNNCDMQVVFTLESGEEVYRSPMLHPGEYLQYDYLDKTLAAGEYSANATIYVYSTASATDSEQSDTSEQAASATDANKPFATYSERVHLSIGK